MLDQYKWIAIGVAALVLAGAGFGSGFTVATWKAGNDHAQAVQEHATTVGDLKDRVRELEAAVARQNAAADLLKAETTAAKDAKAQAEAHAERLAAFSESRMKKLERTIQDTATTTDDVLRHFWELRQ